MSTRFSFYQCGGPYIHNAEAWILKQCAESKPLDPLNFFFATLTSPFDNIIDTFSETGKSEDYKVTEVTKFLCRGDTESLNGCR